MLAVIKVPLEVLDAAFSSYPIQRAGEVGLLLTQKAATNRPK
jgi:hypothetical protein